MCRCDLEIHPLNQLAWEVWQTLNEFDRPVAVGFSNMIPRHISALTMADMTAGLGGTKEDYERVKLIERLMWPAVQKQYSKK